MQSPSAVCSSLRAWHCWGIFPSSSLLAGLGNQAPQSTQAAGCSHPLGPVIWIPSSLSFNLAYLLTLSHCSHSSSLQPRRSWGTRERPSKPDSKEAGSPGSAQQVPDKVRQSAESQHCPLRMKRRSSSSLALPPALAIKRVGTRPWRPELCDAGVNH